MYIARSALTTTSQGVHVLLRTKDFTPLHTANETRVNRKTRINVECVEACLSVDELIDVGSEKSLGAEIILKREVAQQAFAYEDTITRTIGVTSVVAKLGAKLWKVAFVPCGCSLIDAC